MDIPRRISFRNIDHSPAIEDYVRRRAAKLRAFSERIVSCDVTLEVPHRHQRHGRHYQVRIEVMVPGADLVVRRAPDERSRHQDLYGAIDDAFDNAGRVLQEYVRK